MLAVGAGDFAACDFEPVGFSPWGFAGVDWGLGGDGHVEDVVECRKRHVERCTR